VHSSAFLHCIEEEKEWFVCGGCVLW
jgi:hypothetical protein